MKKIIITAVIFLVSITAIFNLSKVEKKEMKKETKQTLVNYNKKEKKKNSKSEDIDSENINTENVEINDSEVNETKGASAIDENNNTGNNSNNNNNQNNSTTQQKNNKNSITSDSAATPIQPEKVLTEWEKIGISEYVYYNTPNDNEGELAIKGDIRSCKNELNRLLNTYYDNGFDGGNTFTINGKYTHSYLGCGINVYINGKTYTYNQVKSMGYN